MNGISAYQTYQNSYTAGAGIAEKYVKTNGDTKQSKSVLEKTSLSEVKKEQVTLSDDAKALLEKLKKTYGNMDFTVADYNSSEEAQKYLSGSVKEYSVLIDPQLLEAMAVDEETEAKYTGLLESAVTELSNMKEELGEESDVLHLGVSFGADGSTAYYAELEKSSEKQRERIEKTRAEKKKEAQKAEEKAEEKKEAQKAEEKKETQKTERSGSSSYETNKRVTLYADSVEELLEKIRNVDWDKVKEQSTVGGKFDLGV